MTNQATSRTITISGHREEAENFVAWLNENGFSATVGNTDSLSENEINSLWDRYVEEGGEYWPQ